MGWFFLAFSRILNCSSASCYIGSLWNWSDGSHASYGAGRRCSLMRVHVSKMIMHPCIVWDMPTCRWGWGTASILVMPIAWPWCFWTFVRPFGERGLITFSRSNIIGTVRTYFAGWEVLNSISYVQDLDHSIPRRIHGVLKAKGGPTVETTPNATNRPVPQLRVLSFIYFLHRSLYSTSVDCFGLQVVLTDCHVEYKNRVYCTKKNLFSLLPER